MSVPNALEDAVRTALKNHSTASGHESTQSLVERILSESKGSGGPISPGKAAARELANQARSRGAGESAGNPGGKGVDEKATNATGSTADKGTDAEKTNERGKGGGKVEDHGSSVSAKPSAQSSERPTEPGKAPGPDSKTSTALTSAGNKGYKDNKGTYEAGADYPDGAPRASAEELFSQAGTKARALIKKNR